MLLALGIVTGIAAFIGDLYTWYLVARYTGLIIYAFGGIFLSNELVDFITFVLNFYVWYRYGVWWPVAVHVLNLLVWVTYSYLHGKQQGVGDQP